MNIQIPSRLTVQPLMVALTCFLAFSTGQAAADEIDDAIKQIQRVGSKGSGHEQAIEAIKVLNRCPLDRVPQLLAAMNETNPLGQNWLRAAINGSVARGGKLPKDQILAYFKNHSGSHLGRLLAFELLKNNDPAWADQIIPKLHDDPSLPLRRMAIKFYVNQSADSEPVMKIGLLGFALNHARDVDQVEQIKKALSENGIEIDLKKQLGFLSEWHLAGPFDNKDQKGFAIAYGPEKTPERIDLTASFDDGLGKPAGPAPVKWEKHTTLDEMGVVDLNQVVGKVKGASVYAFSEFDSDEERDAEIRIGCINANKVWVNGKLVISNEVYHVGMMPDQFAGKTRLKKGVNQILFKVCQNEMTQPWAQRWAFQLRICDPTGKAITESGGPSAETGGQ